MTQYYYYEGSFLNSMMHVIPDEAIALTDDEYRDLLKASSESLELSVANGRVVKVKPHTPTSWYRDFRDSVLRDTSWLVERHRDELEMLTSTTLSAVQYSELQVYRQRLRDWPSEKGWPDVDVPAPPTWLDEMLKYRTV